MVVFAPTASLSFVDVYNKSWGRSHKTFLGVILITLFVSYTILELWKHIVDDNGMVYLTKNPE